MPILYCPPCHLAHATPYPVWRHLEVHLSHGAQVLVWQGKGFGPMRGKA